MTPLLDQFLSESRDLIERASQGFMALEKAPDDASVLDDLFRSVHTIKGASGLFDIQPFTAVVHAAEDVLDALRDHRLQLTPEMIDLLLEALDQIERWLGDLEAHEALPEDAAPAGRSMSAALRTLLPEDDTDADAGAADAEASAANEGDAVSAAWLSDLPAGLLSNLKALVDEGASLWAVEYIPSESCFFSGDDPLHTVLQLPGRRWLGVEPVRPWPGLDEFDPYTCNLRFRAVAEASGDELRDLLRYVEEQVVLIPVRASDLTPAHTPADALSQSGTTGEDAPANAADAPVVERAQVADAEVDPVVAAAAVEVLESQVAALSVAGAAEAWQGRLVSAGIVLQRVFARIGLHGHHGRVQAAVDEAVHTRSAKPIQDLIDSGLEALSGPEPATEPVDGSASGDDVARTLPTTAETPRRRWDDPKPGEPGEARRAAPLKVDQSRIDALMSLAGELVVAKNSLPFLASRAEDVYGSRQMAREIKSQYEVINRIVSDLQTAVMQVRMVPVSSVFQRFNRLVRDLSRKLDKQIRLEIEGEDTEADKTVVEELADPLVHLIRNAVDHGLEKTEDRIAAGKPAEGLVRLSARQVDDRVTTRR